MPVNFEPNATINITLSNEKDLADVVELIKCCCGKAWKGVKGPNHAPNPRPTNNGVWLTTFSSKLLKISALTRTMRMLIQLFI